MNITERARAQMEMTVKWRQSIWDDAQIRDVPPQIGWITEGSEKYEHAPIDVIQDLYEQAGGDDTPSVVFSVLTHASKRPNFTKFREVLFITEAYGYEGTPDDPPPPSLEEDYRTNPESKVYEQMTLVVVADDLVGGAEAAVVMQPFRISDGGRMTFGEPQVFGPDARGEVDSQIIAAMKWGVLHAHEG